MDLELDNNHCFYGVTNLCAELVNADQPSIVHFWLILTNDSEEMDQSQALKLISDLFL